MNMATLIAANPKAYRLPKHVLPRRYDIHLDARLGRDRVKGHVDIDLNIVEPGETIELHARELTIHRVKLVAGGHAIEGKAVQDADREMASLAFGQPLPVGDARLEIDFDGQVSKGLEGLYLAQDGPEQCLCTQCEETDARAIFPCFDEPSFKAQFAWKVTTSPEATVLANGPLVSC